MFKLIAFVVLMTITIATAKPNPLVAYSAPLVASVPAAVVAASPSAVTATSSQYFARNFNSFAAPLVAASPVVSSAYTTAYASPTPYASPYAYSAYSPFAYSASYVL